MTAPQPAVDLPSAVPTTSERPIVDPAVHPVVFFDGECGFCNRAVNSLFDRDRREVLRFAPLQGPTAATLVAEADRVRLDTLVLIDSAGRHVRSTAVVRILKHLGGRYAILSAALWMVPRFLRDLGYRFVSRHRLKLAGKSACRFPSESERRRMLP